MDIKSIVLREDSVWADKVGIVLMDKSTSVITAVNERKLMKALINGFINSSSTRHKAIKRILGHCLHGFGETTEWLDAIKSEAAKYGERITYSMEIKRKMDRVKRWRCQYCGKELKFKYLRDSHERKCPKNTRSKR